MLYQKNGLFLCEWKLKRPTITTLTTGNNPSYNKPLASDITLIIGMNPSFEKPLAVL